MEYSNSNQIDCFRFSAQNQMLKLNCLLPADQLGMVLSCETTAIKSHDIIFIVLLVEQKYTHLISMQKISILRELTSMNFDHKLN